MEKDMRKKVIIIGCFISFFAFFFGYYISFRINENQKSKVEIIKEIMEEEWYYGIDEENMEKSLEEKMILGMIDMNKDPFTRYLTSLGALADSFIGIGASASIYGDYFIIDEVNSLQAIEAGIQKGDILISIDNNDLKNKSLADLDDLIANKNRVSLKIIRDNREIVINANVVKYNPITVLTKEYGDNISYVKISEFNLDTAQAMEAYFSSLDSKYVNLILDLRGNPGGYVSSVNEVLDLFVASNKVSMSTVNKKGEIKYIKTVDDSCFIFNKIVVLINNMSASGAEALSAALNYHLNDIVTLYGDTTYGKGSAQKTYYFDDDTYFHYTYALWQTPAGVTINKKGVDPEIVSKNTGISSVSVMNKELELYDYGSEVHSIQKILNILGYYNGPLHSFFDEKLSAAISEFQEDNNLTITGNLNQESLRYLAKLIYDDQVKYENDELECVIGSMFS